MENKTNSAIRLNKIVHSAYNNDSKIIVDVWKSIFNIDEPNKHSTEVAVMECLNNLNDEFELFKQKMDKTGFSKKLYESEIKQLQNHLIVLTGINGDWQSRKQKITDVQFKILDFCSEILPNDEIPINDEEIEELKKLLDELEDFIENNSLPTDLNSIIKKHILKIKTALYSYNIKGANVFDEVLQSAYGEVIKNHDLFANKLNTEIKNKLSKVWIRVQTVYKTAKNAEQVYIDFTNITDSIQNLLPSGS
ncbi:MAG: hypothetical protein A2513_07855 [Sulfurimonas sp. RIFOXYD12_FULL_33_39]|uniref:hypothetical protein n=1 Tax=unclassified Sulfurimonas TaxID=2623549 RepID=UPI0008CC062A|nr:MULTISPECIES: hypothetical protein [unclassified Sulfurimonas]OHE10005.1 MAG: hypothetical protein A2513_07855 [Sulfurimonas sp. RIFOXYD12_FULL_33_39]OHE14775.1 MAG: hypothetical protein A2530_02625 [Sulfurimonas sp. RIFOXYD2_FULL_34_21]